MKFVFVCSIILLAVLTALSQPAMQTFVTDAAIIEHATEDVRWQMSGILPFSFENAWVESKPMVLPAFTDAPFISLALEWELDASAEALPAFEVRAFVEGAWSEWQTTAVDPHLNHASARFFSRQIFIGAESESIQLRATDADALASVTVHTINPGATDSSTLEQVTAIRSAPSSKPEQTLRRPPWINRTSWGNPFGQTPNFTPRYTTISHLIVHHTATPNEGSNHDWPAVVRSIWSFHVNSRGWDDIGYNFLIDPNGVLYEGRAGGDGVVGAHFSCANGGTAGIALLGTFTATQPTVFAQERLAEVCAWKASVDGLEPTSASFHSGTGLMLNTISGHRDGNSATNPSACPSGTVCPGTRLYRLLPQIRETAQRILDPSSRVEMIHLHE